MDLITILKDFIQPIVIIGGFIFAIYQYQRQQKFKRLQNLSALWKAFADRDDMMSLFHLMNEIESGAKEKTQELNVYEPKTKLKYLALIEEVSLYISAFEVDKDFAQYLFQWHFYFPYLSSLTTASFWHNIGGQDEMNATYWKKSRDLAKDLQPSLS